MSARQVLLCSTLAGLCGCQLNPGSSRANLPPVSLPFTPPPVRGGTLAVSPDGSAVLLVDRDRAEVHVLALAGHEVGDDQRYGFTHELRAERGVFADGQPVVVLSDGSLARLEASGDISPIGTTCADPRGLAWDEGRGRLWVSCADGELVGVSSTDGSPLRLSLPADLGDIVVQGDVLAVARVRSASVLYVRPEDGATMARSAMLYAETSSSVGSRRDAPQGALRLVADDAQHVLVLHERMRVGPDLQVSTRWGTSTVKGPCNTPAIEVATSVAGPNLPTQNGPVVASLTYASDVAYSPSTHELALTDPSSLDPVHDGPQVVTLPFDQSSVSASSIACPDATPVPVQGQATAVAYLPDGTLLVQTREPATLYIGEQTYPLSDVSVRDTGHDIFHSNTAQGAPCIGCHFDGAGDGHVWDLGKGRRLTTTLRGGLSATAPYHWDGSLADMRELFGVHFPAADGTTLSQGQIDAFSHWVDALPGDAPAPADPSLVTEGRALFTSLGCASCHGADGHSPVAQSVQLGRGELQVPSLVDLTEESPLGHDGCAKSLEDLLSTGGGCHWSEHTVSDAHQRDALAAFLGVPRST